MTSSNSREPLPLFRNEAAEAAADRMGRPVNPSGTSSWILTILFVLVLITLVTFLVAGTYARKETVSGQITLSSGTPRVVSTRPGVVDSVRVSEGQAVKVGDVLFTVVSDAVLTGGARLGEALEAAVADQGEAKQDELAAELGRIDHQREELAVKQRGLLLGIRQLRQEIGLQKERLALSEVTFRDVKPLYEAQQIAAIQYRQYESAVLDAKQGLSALERELQASLTETEGLSAALGDIHAQKTSVIAKTEADKAILKGKQASLGGESGFAVISPVDGVVTALTVQVGAPVVPGNTLAVVVPENSSLRAELWVPSRAIGFVRVGQQVRLMYDAFPYQRFGFGKAVITSVSTVPVPPTDLVGTIEAKEPMFRIQARLESPQVKAYGRKWQLTPGMHLSGDMVLEKRSFLQWILDPLRAASMRS